MKVPVPLPARLSRLLPARWAKLDNAGRCVAATWGWSSVRRFFRQDQNRNSLKTCKRKEASRRLIAMGVSGAGAPTHAIWGLAVCLVIPSLGSAMTREEAEVLVSNHRAIANSDTLRRAAMQSQASIVEALLVLGVDPNERGGSLPQSTLSLATMRSCNAATMLGSEADRDRILDLLLEAGADPDGSEMAGMNTLIMISQRCPGTVVQKLLDAGADYEARGARGFSALSMALTVKNLSAAEALIQHGARLSPETVSKMYPEPPEDEKLASLLKLATAPHPE